MHPDPVGAVEAAASESELLAAVASLRHDGGQSFALGEARVRPLFAEEIIRLEALGNHADAWSRVRVADGFDFRRVRQCSFHGDVVLGAFGGRARVAEGLELPTGVYRSTVADSVIGHDALVRDVALLVNYAVGPGALVLDCGRVTCEAGTTFGVGTELPLAVESGGREVRVYAEITTEVAAAVARSRSRPDLLARYARAAAAYAARAASPRGVVGPGAVVRGTPEVRNTFVGARARVDGATRVADCTLLSNAEEPTAVESGACVTRSVLQWGSRVDTLAVVGHSVLTEHSYAERHAKVTASLLGPNTGVAQGEVTASLVGPFVGFHHQALLIAALWPEGRGNVAHGACVGSNHTSRAPDQEFWPGEGTFLGLGCNIKYPADFSRAPYSVVACGVTTLPQKVTFPFALINAPSARPAEVPPAFNEIVPAWVLSDSLYTLARAPRKQRARDRARRARFDFEVFRPEIVDLMLDAARRLEVVAPGTVYTEREIPGLGKNYLTEPHRRAAARAYRFFAEYYALRGLFWRADAVARSAPAALAGLLARPSETSPWEHQRRLLHDELGITDVREGLGRFQKAAEVVAREVERSKAKDDERGARVLDDYAAAHAPACRDELVRQTWDETRRALRAADELIAALGPGARFVATPNSPWPNVIPSAP